MKIVIIIPEHRRHRGQNALMTVTSWKIKYPLKMIPAQLSIERIWKYFFGCRERNPNIANNIITGYTTRAIVGNGIGPIYAAG